MDMGAVSVDFGGGSDKIISQTRGEFVEKYTLYHNG